jgi:NAD(P)H-dependent FMN reductase
MLRIALIVGSTRAGRFADIPAQWIAAGAGARNDFSLETLDLRTLRLPLLGEPDPEGAADAWREQVDRFDGYIATVAEYNHGPAAALKNALDLGFDEWQRKPIGFVGYGGLGAARAIEQLRAVAIELQMAPIRNAIHISGEVFQQVARYGVPLEDYEHLEQGRTRFFDQLVWWTRALKAAREQPAAALA